MFNIITFDRMTFYFVIFLLIVGLAFSSSPVFAWSVDVLLFNEPSSSVENKIEEEKEKIKVKDIFKALKKVGGEIDCSGCIVEGNLELFKLQEEDVKGNYLFSLDIEYKQYLETENVDETLVNIFANNKIALFLRARIFKIGDKKWKIEDMTQKFEPRIYIIEETEKNLDVYTGTIIIKRPLTFRKAVFKGIISTWDQSREVKKQPPVKFVYKINFIGARFEDHVSLDGAIFEEDAYFGNAHFFKMASFTDASFKKKAEFRSAEFDERALFRKTIFHGETDFAIASFNWLAFFKETEFRFPARSKGANFLFTRFKGETIFAKASFQSIARFVGTQFHGLTYFAENRFEDQVWFAGGCRFDDDVTFKGAKFLMQGPYEKNGEEPRPPVLFSGVQFSGNAVFSGVQFGQVAFTEVGTAADIGLDTIFRGKVDFRGAVFEIIDLRRVIFQSKVDFSGAKLGKRIDFTNVDIERASVRLKWDQLLRDDGKPKFEWKYAFKKGTCLKRDKHIGDNFVNFLISLERNFQEHAQLKDAGQIHYFMEDCKRKNKKGLYNIVDMIFLKGIYGYSVKPWHQIWISLLLIVGFAFLYTHRNVLQYDKTKKKKLRMRITDIPIDWSNEKEEPVDLAEKVAAPKNIIYRYWRGFCFSFYVFTKIGYGGMYVRDKYRYVVIAEWFLGLVLWVLFVVNLSNTWPLLHRLVTILS